MTFTFDPTSPAANQAPSSSQSIIQGNFNSTNNILSVDHITFNNATGGQHKQITYVAPSTQTATGTVAVAYTSLNATGADPTCPNNILVNKNGKFILNPVRAFCTFTAVSVNPVTSITPSNQWNIVSIQQNAGREFVITLTPNAVVGNNYCVFFSTTRLFTVSSNSPYYFNYSITNNVITLTPSTTPSVGGAVFPFNISVTVMQA